MIEKNSPPLIFGLYDHILNRKYTWYRVGLVFSRASVTWVTFHLSCCFANCKSQSSIYFSPSCKRIAKWCTMVWMVKKSSPVNFVWMIREEAWMASKGFASFIWPPRGYSTTWVFIELSQTSITFQGYDHEKFLNFYSICEFQWCLNFHFGETL